MKILKLVLKNFKRHKLRLFLTIGGIGITVMAFTLLRTVLYAWYAGADVAAADRVITRHAVSFIFPLPVAYKHQIANIKGVKKVTYATWFQGIYKDKNQFFPRMAIEPETFFDVYHEYKVKEKKHLQDLITKRNGCIVGVKIAKEYNLKIGDIMVVDGDIYPGTWQFEVVGFYSGEGNKKIDETWMVFNWNYLNESLKLQNSNSANHIGWYVFKIDDIKKTAEISNNVDNLFKNSFAPTKTETEQAFNQSFISMSESIIAALEFISFVIIGILTLVLANTMVMSSRERIKEYAVMKTIGFTAKNIVTLIIGESIFISLIGGIIGTLISFPIVEGIAEALSRFFPIFIIQPSTLIISVVFIIFAGIVSSIVPVMHATKMSIVDGLRHIG